MSKINLGAGSDITTDFTNHDIAPLAGIDVVRDLNVRTYGQDILLNFE